MGARSVAGQRTSKTANGRVTEYIWSGERLLGERLNNGSWTRFYYDSTGIIGYSVGNAVYTFRKNLQGDITGIYDENGVLFGEYEYDAWGNVLAEKVLVTGMYTPLHNNPIRYRGYYYDLETGLYYLNSRYYDPKTGRFLNQDLISYLDPETVNGLNLYTYCLNDPVKYVDPTGHAVVSLVIALAITGALVGGTIAGVTAYQNGLRGGYLAGSIIAGAVAGGAFGALLGIALPGISSFMGSTFVIGNTMTAAGELAAITITGAQILGIGAVLGLVAGILFMGNPYTRNPNDPSNPHRSTKNGKSSWDKHSGKRSGGPEKKDARMKYRKWKRKKIIFPFIFDWFFEYFDLIKEMI